MVELNEDDFVPGSELRLRKRKKVSVDSEKISSAQGSVGSDNLMAKEASTRYRAAIDKMPLPRRISDMKAGGYEAVTYSFLQK